MTSALTWIEEKLQNFGLEKREIDEVVAFSILWPIYESQHLDKNANSQSIKAFANTRAQANNEDESPFEKEFNYFRERYVEASDAADKFAGLRFPENGPDATFVHQTLSNVSASLPHKIEAIFLIIYRFRNNLFHGEKWVYRLQGQRSNFCHANAALQGVIEYNIH